MTGDTKEVTGNLPIASFWEPARERSLRCLMDLKVLCPFVVPYGHDDEITTYLIKFFLGSLGLRLSSHQLASFYKLHH